MNNEPMTQLKSVIAYIYVFSHLKSSTIIVPLYRILQAKMMKMSMKKAMKAAAPKA